jgi:type IV pilus assembly protein PilB
MMARPRIGELLVRMGHLDGAQLQAALAYQRQWGGRIGRAIVRLGFIGESALLGVLGQQLGVPFVIIGDRQIPQQLLDTVPRKLVEARRVLPLEIRPSGRRGATLVVALGDPSDLGVIDEITFVTGMHVIPVLAGEVDLDRALQRCFGISPRAHSDFGFADRDDAIELPEDTSPLRAARRGADWDGDPTLH